ncbi:MAG: DUF3619 family protein, partial [Gammaproteobacteria bacterium]
MNDPMQHKLVEALDRRARDLDGQTLSRLRRARAAAIGQAEHHATWLPVGGWRLAGAGLAVALLVATLIPALYRPLAPPTLPEEEELLEIATLDTDLELVEEMEFYEWLSAQPLEEVAEGG